MARWGVSALVMRRRRGRLAGAFLVGWLTILPLGCPAAPSDADPWRHERARFVQAEQAFEQGRTSEYRRLLRELEDYPLYPYLVYADLDRRLEKARPDEVGSFLRSYAGSPFAERLRERWLRILERQGRWREYLAFDVPSRSVERQCRNIWAQYQTGERQAAFARVEPLWLVGRSQPEACDRVFAAWRATGHLTEALAMERFRLALARDDAGLARHMTRYLSATDRGLAERLLTLHEHPERVLSEGGVYTDSPASREAVVYGLSRLAREAPAQAAAAWPRLERRYAFDAAARAKVFRAIGLGFAKVDDRRGLDWLARISPEQADADVYARAVRTALARSDWAAAREWIERMPAGHDLAWRFWLARAREALGEHEPARELYREVSTDRGFYGFLAADRLGVPYRLEDRPLQVATPTVARVARMPGVARAGELLRLDRGLDARREWRDAIASMDREELTAAALIADRWGWHDQAILTVAKAEHYDDLGLRFPLAYRDAIVRQARVRGLDSAWVYGVLRQESAFAPDARSSAGALGLMQLMPATAKHVARKIDYPLRSNYELLVPETNIKLGTTYLRMVLDQLGDQPVFATAAYNAGPGRVKRWTAERGHLPLDVWIETVPFNETRQYLQRVLTYTAIYEWRLGATPTRLSERLGLRVRSAETGGRVQERVSERPAAEAPGPG